MKPRSTPGIVNHEYFHQVRSSWECPKHVDGTPGGADSLDRPGIPCDVAPGPQHPGRPPGKIPFLPMGVLWRILNDDRGWESGFVGQQTADRPLGPVAPEEN